MTGKVILHLGAHRTGTTSLQTAFDVASKELQEAGIVALTPPRPGKRIRPTVRKLANVLVSAKRPGAKLLAPLKRRAAKKLLHHLLRMQTGNSDLPRRLILSDEKMLGRAFGKDGQSIYPYARAHLRSVQNLMPVKVDEVHMTLRSYDTFLVSVYAMRAVYAHNVPPFDEIGETLTALHFKWSDLVEAIRSAFPDSRLVLSVFEESELAQRAQSLLGEEGKLISIGNKIPPPLNRAPTQEAIDRAQRTGHKPSDSDVVVEEFSDGKLFDPLSDEQKRALRKQYYLELEQLRSRGNVEWIS